MNDILFIINDAFVAGACILIFIGLYGVFYPILSGQICSWHAPCGLKEGYDCSTCTLVNRKKNHGVLDTIVELVTFGVVKKV